MKLVIKAVDRASADLKKISGEVTALGGAAAGVGTGFGRMVSAMGLGTLAANALSSAFSTAKNLMMRATTAIVGFAKESIATSGQAETLTISLDVLAKNAGIAEDSIQKIMRALRDSNKSYLDSVKLTQDFIVAGFGQKKILDLVSASQDVAAAKGLVSRDVLNEFREALIQVNPQLMKNTGIVVSLREAMERYQQETGKASGAMSVAEKRQAMFNEIMRQTLLFEGSYEAELLTWEKQLNSLTGAYIDLQTGIGRMLDRSFQPFLQSLKTLRDNLLDNFLTIDGDLSPALERLGNVITRLISPSLDKFADYLNNLDFDKLIQQITATAEQFEIMVETVKVWAGLIKDYVQATLDEAQSDFENLSDYLNNTFLSDAQSFTEGVAVLLAKLTISFKETYQYTKSYIEAMILWYWKIPNSLIDIVKNVGNLLWALVTGIWDTGKETGRGVANMIKVILSSFGGLGPGVQNAVGFFVVLNGAVGAILKVTAYNIGKWIGSVSNALGKFYQNMKDNARTAGLSIGSALLEIDPEKGQAIINSIAKITGSYKKAGTEISTSWEGVQGAVNETGSSVTSFIDQLNKMYGNLNNINEMEGAKDFRDKLLQSALDVKNEISDIQEKNATHNRLPIEGLDEDKNDIEEFGDSFNSLADDAEEGGGKTAEEIQKAIDSIRANIKDYVGSWYEAKNDIADIYADEKKDINDLKKDHHQAFLDMKQDLKDLKSDYKETVADIKSDIRDLTSEYKNSQKELTYDYKARLYDEVNSIKDSIASKKKAIEEELKLDFWADRNKIDELQAQIDKEQAMLDSHADIIKDTNGFVKKDAIQQIRDDYIAQKTENENNFNDRLATLKEQLASEKVEYDKSRAEINNTWASTVTDYEDKLNNIKEITKNKLADVTQNYIDAFDKIVKEISDSGVWQLFNEIPNLAGMPKIKRNLPKEQQAIQEFGRANGRLPESSTDWGWVNKWTYGTPTPQFLAKGGIITSPTLAMMGEKGSEAVIPLDKLDKLGNTINFTFNNPVFKDENDRKLLIEQIKASFGRDLEISAITGY